MTMNEEPVSAPPSMPSSAPTGPTTALPHSQPPAASTFVVGANASGRVGTVRNPWLVWVFGIITLGIYTLWWYYKVNAEVREYDHSVQVQPGVSVLAITLGALLIVPPIVSFVRTGGRIASAQRAAGLRSRCSGLLGLLANLVLGLGVVYYQAELNKVWERAA